MVLEEALAIVAAALAPQSLSELQIDVFRGAWNKESYQKTSLKLKYEYSYIKDVGAELWQLLTQKLGIQVTKLNLQDALMHYAQQGQRRNLSVSSQCCHVNWGEAPDVSQFCGRQAQLTLLEQWVMQDRCRLIAIAGIAGIGKTMVVTQLTQQLVDSDQFEVVVWRSLQQAPPLVDFLTELLQTLSAERISAGTAPDQSYPPRLDAMIRHLLEQLRHQRCLLILDSVDAVLCGSELIGSYRPGYEDYGWLFQQLGEGRHQSSVLLTSRETPAEVVLQAGPTAAVRQLQLEGLSLEEGEAILATKGLSVQIEEVQELIERYQGNPLALKIAATAIQSFYDNNIAAFLVEETKLFNEIHDSLAYQCDRLSVLEQQVMYWLTVKREAVTAVQSKAEHLPSVSQAKLQNTVMSPDRQSLIEISTPTLAKPLTSTKLDDDSDTQQSVMMKYITKQLSEKVCQHVN